MIKIKKLMEYAISEITMAEDYIKIAESICEEEAMALKFQEMAKDELKHHQYDIEVIKKELEKKKEKGEHVLELEDSLLYDVYKDWFGNVEARVNNFKVKK